MVDQRLLEKIIQGVARSGKLILGGKEVLESVKGSKLVVYTTSYRTNEIANILADCRTFSVPCIPFEGNSMKLGRLCGRHFKVSVLAVRSAGEVDLEPLLSSA